VEDYESEVEAIMSMPNNVAVMPSFDHEEEWMKQVRWSIPDTGYNGLREYVCTHIFAF
jgi:hypothetical protein